MTENTSFHNFSALVFTQALYLREVKAIIKLMFAHCALTVFTKKKNTINILSDYFAKVKTNIISFTSQFAFPPIMLACASDSIPLLWSPSDRHAVLHTQPQQQQLWLCSFTCLHCSTLHRISYHIYTYIIRTSPSYRHPCAKPCACTSPNDRLSTYELSTL